MDIASKTKVTTVYSTTLSADEAKALALVAVKSKIGLDAGAVVISSEATQSTDGSIAVEVVVEASDAAPADDAHGASAAPAPSAPLAPVVAGLAGLAPVVQA